MGFIKRYWHGEVSLVVSYWLVGWAVYFIVLLTSEAFSSFVESRSTFNPITLFLSYASLVAFLSALSVWQLVGLWKSAARYVATPNKPKLWGRIALFMTVVSALNLIVTYKSQVYPAFSEMFQMAFSGDPTIPPYKVTVTEGGTELKIEGGLKFGLLEDVQKAFAFTPSITTVDLESVGGRVGVAADLYNFLSKLGVNTVTNEFCVSACAYVFASGKNRWLAPDGKLGFHSAAFANLSDKEANEGARDIESQISREQNIPLAFFDKASNVSSDDMWFPDKQELLKANFITSMASKAVSSRKLIEQRLIAGLSDLKRRLPLKVDDATILTSVNVVGTTLSYRYEVSNDVANVLARVTRRRRALQHQVQEQLCQSPTSGSLIDDGVAYRYEYRHALTKKVVSFFEINACDRDSPRSTTSMEKPGVRTPSFPTVFRKATGR